MQISKYATYLNENNIFKRFEHIEDIYWMLGLWSTENGPEEVT